MLNDMQLARLAYFYLRTSVIHEEQSILKFKNVTRLWIFNLFRFKVLYGQFQRLPQRLTARFFSFHLWVENQRFQFSVENLERRAFSVCHSLKTLMENPAKLDFPSRVFVEINAPKVKCQKLVKKVTTLNISIFLNHLNIV